MKSPCEPRTCLNGNLYIPKNGDIVNLQHKNAGGVGFQYALMEFQQVLSLGEAPEVLQ